jgi:hypothetical protein
VGKTLYVRLCSEELAGHQIYEFMLQTRRKIVAEKRHQLAELDLLGIALCEAVRVRGTSLVAVFERDDAVKSRFA